MKLTNAEIRATHEGAQALAAADLPFPTAMKLYEAIEILTPRAHAVESERVKLIQKYGEQSSKGFEVKPTTRTPAGEETNPKWTAFQNEFAELLTLEQEITELPKILLSELGEPEALKKMRATANHLGALRRVGLLAADPPPATRPERRRAAKEEGRSKARLKVG